MLFSKQKGLFAFARVSLVTRSRSGAHARAQRSDPLSHLQPILAPDPAFRSTPPVRSSSIKSSPFPPSRQSSLRFSLSSLTTSTLNLQNLHHVCIPPPPSALPLCLSEFLETNHEAFHLAPKLRVPRGLFDMFSKHHDDVHHKGSFTHESIAGAAAFEAMKSWEDKCKRDGHPNNHAMAKEMLAGFVAGEVDKLIETKGLDYIDAQKAKSSATQQVHQYYDEEWVPNNFTGSNFTPKYN